MQLGRYELLTELGRGGMAQVYVGRLRGVGGFSKLVAIKRMLPHLDAPAFAALFVQEANFLSVLTHPNICQVFELGQDGAELFIAMELLDGVAWDSVLSIGGAADLRLVAGVMSQAAEGLHFAHHWRDASGALMPILHRDISPQNLFVTVDGVCKLLDFGVAKMIPMRGPLTRTGVVKGKLSYMSPEQALGHELDARSDVFALGIVAWESLTGSRLYDRDSDFAVMKAIVEEPIPAVTSLRPSLPPAIDAVLARALARDRDARYAGARELAAALAQVGGMMMPREIADVLRDSCSIHTAARQHAIQTALELPVADEPSAASTVRERPGSVALRRGTAVVARPRRRRRIAIGGLVVVAAAAAIAIAVTFTGGAPAQPAPIPAAPIPAPVVAVAPSPPPQPSPSPTPQPPTPVAHASPHHAISATHATPHAPTATTPSTGGIFNERDKQDIDNAIDQLGALGANADGLRKLKALGANGATGTLTIQSNTPATIFVDGARIGDTPVTRHPLSAGPHHIRAVTADGQTRELDIDVAADRESIAPKLF